MDLASAEPGAGAARGYLALVLHAHLPFVRHPEYEEFLEERWLFEAITECYLPLLEVLFGLARDQVPHRIAISLSPTLLNMLADPLLQARYLRHTISRRSPWPRHSTTSRGTRSPRKRHRAIRAGAKVATTRSGSLARTTGCTVHCIKLAGAWQHSHGASTMPPGRRSVP